MTNLFSKILIIDSSLSDLKLLGNDLNRHYTVLTATNTLQATGLIECKQPDLILIDPFADGIDINKILLMLRSNNQAADTPVISIYGPDKNISESIYDNTSDLILKPIDIRKLRSKIERFLTSPGNLNKNESVKNALPKVSKTSDLNVLVVEDDILNRELIEAMLGKLNCKVTLAANGTCALECISKHTFDLIFCDLNLPDKNGKELIVDIRTILGSTTPVIAISGHTNKEIIAECLSLGFTDYLIKPFDVSDLKRTISLVFKLKKTTELLIEKPVPRNELGYDKARELAGNNASLLIEWMGNLCLAIENSLLATQTIREKGEYTTEIKCFHDLRNHSAYFDINRIMIYLGKFPEIHRSQVDYVQRFNEATKYLYLALAEAREFFNKEKEKLNCLI